MPCQVVSGLILRQNDGQSDEETWTVPAAVPSVLQRIPSSELGLVVENSSRPPRVKKSTGSAGGAPESGASGIWLMSASG